MAAALAFLAATILFVVVFRFVAGHRLQPPHNGRQRQPRLGIVDEFDLDRRRQLVIVRRDNVEHLLMIGGPNDFLIESQIIRAEARDLRTTRDARLRERELRERDEREPPLAPAGVSWPHPGEAQRAGSPLAPKPALEAESGVSDRESTRIPIPAAAIQAARSGASPLASRRGTAQLNLSGQRPAPQSEPFRSRANLKPVSEVEVGAAKEFPAVSPHSAFLRPPMQRARQGIAAKPAPSVGPERAPAESHPHAAASLAEAAPSQGAGAAHAPISTLELASPAAAEVAPEGTVRAAEPIQAGAETLEEEMAQLLGRGSG